jgi:hypothetical protein
MTPHPSRPRRTTPARSDHRLLHRLIGTAEEAPSVESRPTPGCRTSQSGHAATGPRLPARVALGDDAAVRPGGGGGAGGPPTLAAASDPRTRARRARCRARSDRRDRRSAAGRGIRADPTARAGTGLRTGVDPACRAAGARLVRSRARRSGAPRAERSGARGHGRDMARRRGRGRRLGPSRHRAGPSPRRAAPSCGAHVARCPPSAGGLRRR